MPQHQSVIDKVEVTTESVGVAILAGGQSSRLGDNKAFAKVGGQPLIERVIERVRPLGNELIIIANVPDEYVHLGFSIHADIVPGKGPLGGLHTAIASTQSMHTLVVGCDQPFLNPELLRFLIGLRSGYDIVVPLDQEGRPQGLHTVYGKGCLEPIHHHLESNQLKLVGFFSDVHVREVADDVLDRFDPLRLSFFNVNTPEDLKEAQRLATILARNGSDEHHQGSEKASQASQGKADRDPP